MSKTQQHIQRITGMNDEDMYRIVFTTGMAYLAYETFYNDAYTSEIAQKPEYWEFWKAVVASRNRLFVQQFGTSPLSRRELTYIYEALLDVRSLSIYPPDYNWADGYNNCIVKLINNQKSKATCQ